MNRRDEIPKLYDVAKEVCLSHGIPWTDPRTGQTFRPKKGRFTRLVEIRGVPYRCKTCGEIQLNTGYRESNIVNCDRTGCHGDDIVQVGPLQIVTVVVYQKVQSKSKARPKSEAKS